MRLICKGKGLLKKRIGFVIISRVFISPIVFAGQGLYLKMSGYLPNSSVQVTDSNCVDGIENISMNSTTYVDANISVSVFSKKLGEIIRAT